MRRIPPFPVVVGALSLLAACADDGASGTTTASVTVATTVPDTTVPGTAPDTSVGDTAASTTEAPTSSTTIPLAPGMVTLTPTLSGLTKPVDLAWHDGVMYVAQQDGLVVPVRDGKAGLPAIDLSRRISNGNEQGLLGIAFHPTAALVYLDYTNQNGDTIVAEFPVKADGSFDAGAERQVITVDQPYANHNGGKITFGPDGMLYIGLGDGGKAGDPQRHAQDLGSLLGKILRIDPTASGSQPYTVPADNPFVGTAGAKPEIWARGLRNPWRFDFDTLTGDLWIADVGQNKWEEVDHSPAVDGKDAGKGANYGWSALEGNHPYNADQTAPDAVPPVYEYPHPDGCSVSGGAVYRGSAVPSLYGWYVFADYCTGVVTALQPDGTTVVLGTVGSVSAVVDGPDGELYVLGHGEGVLYLVGPA